MGRGGERGGKGGVWQERGVGEGRVMSEGREGVNYDQPTCTV